MNSQLQLPRLAQRLAIAVLLAWGLTQQPGLRAEPALPQKPTTFVTDEAGVLSTEARARLNRELANFERETSNQLLVALYPRLPEGTFLEEYANKTFHAWAVGDKAKDNGIILFAFIQDRKVRIEVGYGLEGAVPDSIAARIIREELAPRFRVKDYDGGVTAAMAALQKATRGEYQGKGSTTAQENSGSGGFWLFLVLIIVFLIWVHSGDTVLQRAGRDITWAIASGIFSGHSSSGGSSSDSGSSDSWSGGGGDSGGGGASGDW